VDDDREKAVAGGLVLFGCGLPVLLALGIFIAVMICLAIAMA
jgi:hypothetical protein